MLNWLDGMGIFNAEAGFGQRFRGQRGSGQSPAPAGIVGNGQSAVGRCPAQEMERFRKQWGRGQKSKETETVQRNRKRAEKQEQKEAEKGFLAEIAAYQPVSSSAHQHISTSAHSLSH